MSNLPVKLERAFDWVVMESDRDELLLVTKKAQAGSAQPVRGTAGRDESLVTVAPQVVSRVVVESPETVKLYLRQLKTCISFLHFSYATERAE